MGIRIVFRRTSADTAGESMEYDAFLAPGREIVGRHVHPRQTERFTVISGRVRGRVGGEERMGGPGDVQETPPGVPHVWWNDSPDEELHLRVVFIPALHTELMFERIFAWAAAGKVDKRGVPSLLRLAVLLRCYPDEFYPAQLPIPLLKALFRVLAPIGRLRGYGTDLPDG